MINPKIRTNTARSVLIYHIAEQVVRQMQSERGQLAVTSGDRQNLPPSSNKK